MFVGNGPVHLSGSHIQGTNFNLFTFFALSCTSSWFSFAAVINCQLESKIFLVLSEQYEDSEDDDDEIIGNVALVLLLTYIQAQFYLVRNCIISRIGIFYCYFAC